MIKNYKHIIWDWNGTLWDDSWLCFEITNQMLSKRFMAAMSQELYQRIMRFPIKDYYIDLGFDYTRESSAELAQEFIDMFETRRFECKLQDGAVDVLQGIAGSSITQSVLSAYKHDTLLQAVRYFGLLDFFDDIIGLDDIYADSKVDNGLKYMDSLSYDIREVLFIGDTIHDFEVAQAMGIDCVLVESGHNSRLRLEDCNVPVLSTLHGLLL